MDNAKQRHAICLLSGGLDSSTVLAIAKQEGFSCYCLAFDYGQRHIVELESARKVAAYLKAEEFRVAKIDLRVFGGSALTSEMAVPKDRAGEEIAAGIPSTYVPARNTIFLAFALAYAEVSAAFDIFIGVNSIDYSGYPDCRPEFIAAFENMANLATKAGVEGTSKFHIHMPLSQMNKADIIRKAAALSVDLSLTHSCYDPHPDGRPCNSCDACILRANGFEAAGMTDPVLRRS